MIQSLPYFAAIAALTLRKGVAVGWGLIYCSRGNASSHLRFRLARGHRIEVLGSSTSVLARHFSFRRCRGPPSSVAGAFAYAAVVSRRVAGSPSRDAARRSAATRSYAPSTTAGCDAAGEGSSDFGAEGALSSWADAAAHSETYLFKSLTKIPERLPAPGILINLKWPFFTNTYICARLTLNAFAAWTTDTINGSS